jgi:hypothetical protein
MLGFIYVDDTGNALKTDSKGQVSFAQNAPKKILLWHPRLNQAKGEQLEFALDKSAEKNVFTLKIDLDKPLDAPSEKGFKSKFKRKFSGPGS